MSPRLMHLVHIVSPSEDQANRIQSRLPRPEHRYYSLFLMPDNLGKRRAEANSPYSLFFVQMFRVPVQNPTYL